MGSIMIGVVARMGMAVIVMMTAPAEEQNARDIHYQSEHCNWDRLIEANRNGPDKAPEGFVADEERDHRKHDGTRKPREVAELPGAESEAGIVRVPPRVTIGEGGE